MRQACPLSPILLNIEQKCYQNNKTRRTKRNRKMEGKYKFVGDMILYIYIYDQKINQKSIKFNKPFPQFISR